MTQSGDTTKAAIEQWRFIDQCPCEPKDLMLSSDAELLEDYRGRSLLVFSSYWSIDFNIKKNPGLVLSETRSAEE